ncbi:hypothetical protein [Brucella tritici]|uniref:Phospholipase D-like domain-containing protein n=1 Tax=Brucella tritici TaxID=94626 RepID=A0A6L3YNB6_9HYPH|nr:hypothetical protein [Brucella tritici]KAB2684431.1 hypothetical protein F9L08_14180 [Brucella tritici]
MNPLDLVSGSPWRSVAFTTYALSLSFFEAVILDRLIRGGGRQALILADPEGVRSGLSEEGARRAGRDYDIEPVACTTGVFHPKMSVFASDDDIHLLVGSGNLTFGGWGGNMEVVEHLHPSFAPDAINDAADMFELIALSERIRTEAGPACIRLAESLRRVNRPATTTGNIRLIHSVGGSVATEIQRFAGELGGARRITIVSPYHDLDGRGVDALADALSCDDVQLHAHPHGTVRGLRSASWPFEGTRERSAVEIATLFQADHRALHAKAIEILCRRGRLLIAGSANSTHAGLFGANVEASVLRIQRNSLLGWKPVPALPPERSEAEVAEEDEDTSDTIGILRASLESGTVKATVIAPAIRGRVSVYLKTVRTTHELGYAYINGAGRLSIDAPGLEREAWENGRLVLRVEQFDKVLEGFVTITAATELVRRAGPMAPRLFAILAGNETPADVAAMLAWFREDPARLPRAAAISTASTPEDKGEGSAFVHLGSLEGVLFDNSDPADGGERSVAWEHAMALLRSAFSTARGPWNVGGETDDDEEDDRDAREKRIREYDQQNVRSLENFEALLPRMIEQGSASADPILALALTHFVTDRIRPPAAKVRAWLGQILPAISSYAGAVADQALASLLVYYGTDGAPNRAARVRRALLKRDVDVLTLDPQICATIPAFMELIAQDFNAVAFITEIVRSKTAGEEVRDYLFAAASGAAFDNSVLLAKSEHWPKLEKALIDPELFKKFYIFETPPTACPRCYMNFPRASSVDLRQLGVTSCCGRLIFCKAI